MEPARVYLKGRKIAHYSDQGTVTHCHLWCPQGFWGTGSQEEYEKAESLPMCKRCVKP